MIPVFACTAPGSPGPKSPKPRRGVRAAALPFVVYDRAGSVIAETQLMDRLAAARAICIGEDHKNPHHHWAQLYLFEKLAKRQLTQDKQLGLGMEMFQRPFQEVLDAYAAGTIDDRVMLARTEWRERWGYDYKLYRPIMAVAVQHGAPLVALNARKELTRKVGKKGVEGLSPEERNTLPSLDLKSAAHRAWFEDIMSEHPGEVTDKMYTAQVLWDETMAETAAAWLGAQKARQLAILAGNGHCHDSAIVGRIARRGVTPSVSVHPVIDDGNGSADEALRAQHNDFVFVMTMPPH